MTELTLGTYQEQKERLRDNLHRIFLATEKLKSNLKKANAKPKSCKRPMF